MFSLIFFLSGYGPPPFPFCSHSGCHHVLSRYWGTVRVSLTGEASQGGLPASAISGRLIHIQHSDPTACIPLSVTHPWAWFSGPLPLSCPTDLLLDPIWVFLLHLCFLVPLNVKTRLTNVFCFLQWIIDHRLVNYLAFSPKDCFEVGPNILLTMMFVHTAHWLSASQAN